MELRFSRFLYHLLCRTLRNKTATVPRLFQALQQHSAIPWKKDNVITSAINLYRRDVSSTELLSLTVNALDGFFVHGQFQRVISALLSSISFRSLRNKESLKPIVFNCIWWSHSRNRFGRMRPYVVATVLKRLSSLVSESLRNNNVDTAVKRVCSYAIFVKPLGLSPIVDNVRHLPFHFNSLCFRTCSLSTSTHGSLEEIT